MPSAWRKFLTGMVLLLSGGALVGALYGHADWGLLVAALLGLFWQTRMLLAFDKALRTRKFEDFRYGDSIWSQMFARFSHLKQRSRKHKRRYRKVLKEVRDSTNAMPDGGIVLNADNEIILCNLAARNLVGFSASKDRGQRVDNILRNPRFHRYLQSGDFDTGVEIRSPMREDGWLFVRIVPYGANQRLMLIRDDTERKRLATVRRDFVANASHELRSPLTVITGYLDTLADDSELPSHWQKPIGQMREQAGRMNKIVAELLELSRLETSGTVQNEQEVDVPGLIAATGKSFSGRDDVARVEIQCESGAQLRGSVVEIESIIANLTSNAMRHTPLDGVVTIAWRGVPDGAVLSVSDTGEGIDEIHLPRLTERFFRVDPGRSREGGGIGLGLAIVKHALNRHDAELHIESEFGAGSTFSCHFPLSRVVQNRPETNVPQAG